ncbi:MAG: hypothetical protein ABL986_07950 [Vicinamibacterales bacterium]
MGITITGLDDIRRHLRQSQQHAESLSGTHDVPIAKLLTSEFMLLNTDFESVDAMFAASGYKIESSQDLKSVPDEAWDSFVRSRTRFGSWEELLSEAAKEYLGRRLMGEA